MPEVSQPLTAGTEPVAHVLSLEYDNVEGLNEFLAHSEHSVVGESPPHLLLSLCQSPSHLSCASGFFTDASSKLAKTFKTAADGLRESFRFAHSTSEAVLTEFGYSE